MGEAPADVTCSKREGRAAISDSSLMLLFIKFSSSNKSLFWLTEAKEHEFIGKILEGYWEAHRGQEKAGEAAGLEKRELEPKSRWGYLVPTGH